MADETPHTQPNGPGATPGSPQSQADSLAEQALKAAQDAIAGLGDLASSATPPSTGDTPAPLPLPAFSQSLSPAQSQAIDLLSDVNLNVKIELGRTRMLVEDVLRLAEGAVVELDKLAGDPVDVFVNDRHVARGEVLVLNDNFCVRINEILSPLQDAPVQKIGGDQKQDPKAEQKKASA
jgi:flagellar motor switch protein FliN/FliY